MFIIRINAVLSCDSRQSRSEPTDLPTANINWTDLWETVNNHKLVQGGDEQHAVYLQDRWAESTQGSLISYWLKRLKPNVHFQMISCFLMLLILQNNSYLFWQFSAQTDRRVIKVSAFISSKEKKKKRKKRPSVKTLTVLCVTWIAPLVCSELTETVQLQESSVQAHTELRNQNKGQQQRPAASCSSAPTRPHEKNVGFKQLRQTAELQRIIQTEAAESRVTANYHIIFNYF